MLIQEIFLDLFMKLLRNEHPENKEYAIINMLYNDTSRILIRKEIAVYNILTHLGFTSPLDQREIYINLDKIITNLFNIKVKAKEKVTDFII